MPKVVMASDISVWFDVPLKFQLMGRVLFCITLGYEIYCLRGANRLAKSGMGDSRAGEEAKHGDMIEAREGGSAKP